MKNILVISPEPWDAHAVSKHHYAITLARMGARVYFLDPPSSSKKVIDIRRHHLYPNLFLVTARKVASGLKYLPGAVRNALEMRWLVALEKKAGLSIDVVWLFENSRFFDMRFAGDRLKIYHQVDLNQMFNLSLAASTADICFCTTDLIKDKLAQYSQRVYKIHHGLAQDKDKVDLTELQREKFNDSSVKAMYIGNLDMQYLDVNLLSSVAKKFSNVSFHFVGGFSLQGPLWRQCQHLSNVTWWGKVDSMLIPPILQAADILMVTYQAEHWRDQASPHKFMEYLGSGKVIVATYTAEYLDKHHLLEMVEDSRDYPGAFERVSIGLKTYNNEVKEEERISFAVDHTYERQIERIAALLQLNGLPTPIDNRS